MKKILATELLTRANDVVVRFKRAEHPFFLAILASDTGPKETKLQSFETENMPFPVSPSLPVLLLLLYATSGGTLRRNLVPGASLPTHVQPGGWRKSACS